jgi:hypothetical protein
MSYSGTLKVTNISTVNGTYTTTTDRAIDGTFSAWVNFGRNATGVNIFQSMNVTGVTEISTGNFRIQFKQGTLTKGNYYGITGGGTETAFDGNSGAYLVGTSTNEHTSNYLDVGFLDRGNTGHPPNELLVAVIQ